MIDFEIKKNTSSENENIYFTYDGNIMVSVFDGEKHLKPVNLKLENNENLKGVTPYIAPDESYLIYSLGYKVGEADIYISYRLKNNKWTKPVDLGPDINRKDAMDLCPMVSPDGKYIVFWSMISSEWELYRYEVETTMIYKLTTSAMPGDAVSRPTWSPDSTRIAFVSAKDGDMEIFTIKADGTDMQQITFNNDDDYDPAWLNYSSQ